MDFSLPENTDDSRQQIVPKKCSFYPLTICGWAMPQRIILVIFLFFGMSICSSLEFQTENILKISKKRSHGHEDNNISAFICKSIEDGFQDLGKLEWNYVTEGLSNLYNNWNINQRFLVRYSYICGYSLGHIPGFILADRYGGKFLIIVSVVTSSTIHLLYPLLLHNSPWYRIFIVRLLQGLFVGPMFPVAMTVFMRWAPIFERATLASFIFSGYDFGVVASRLIHITYFKFSDQWKTLFILQSVFVYIWIILFVIYCSTEPREHSLITRKELEHIERSFVQETVLSRKIKTPPYFLIIRNLPALIIMIAFAVNLLVALILYYFMNKYMIDILGMQKAASIVIITVEWCLVALGGAVTGGICDRLVNKKLLKYENSRKMFAIITGGSLAICFIPITYAKCTYSLFYVFMFIAALLLGANASILRINMLDLSCNYAGTVIGITEGTAHIVSVIGGYIVYFFLEKGAKKQILDGAFWAFFALLLLSNVILMPCSSCKEQPFNTYVSRKQILKLTPTYPARF